jgi:ATP-dependent Zn protease
VSDEDENFREHEERRVARERESILPMDLGSGGGGSSSHGMKDQASRRDLIKADVLPLQIDAGIGFASVGGLDSHLMALKEMVILPLLYPDVFQHFDTQPPRGVLFSGPPGCGKVRT